MTESPVCVFGEVLFDHFPDGTRVLGGAPFNVAWHLQAFGQSPRFVSRVGNDDDGAQIRRAMTGWGMDTSGLQTDDALPTGRVTVSLAGGEPSYDIVHPCAYDAIAPADVGSWRLLYHGSLALRSPTSRAALGRLASAHTGQVFLDVNLRPPWWQRDAVRELLRTADWVKLNTDEMRELLGSDAADDAAIDDLLATYELQGVVLTHGERGAQAATADGQRSRIAPQNSDRVVDTVGAGDAFASVMILGLLRAWPLQETLERAQQFASRIVGQRGATVADPSFYRQLADAWAIDA
ncbi:MAG: carbohydrate kinase [Gammaproteobacteria bacterium]|nr:carbohydrate kinase [Gammaproteobacteria bacterium]